MTRSTSPSDYNTRITIQSEDEYKWLDSVRKGLGLTWRGMMLKAEQRLLAAERTWPPALRTQDIVPAPAQSNVDIEAERQAEADTEPEAESDGDTETTEVTR